MPSDGLLHKAAYKADLDELTQLVQDLKNTGESIDQLGAQNRTPLMRACGSKEDPEDVLQVIKFLLDENANINAVDSSKRTCLHWAVVDLLLDREVSVDSCTISGATALHMAAREGYTQIVSKLLQHKANKTLSCEGKTPLDFAIENKHKAIIQMLREPQKKKKCYLL